jgi:hypothetical protein
MNGGMKLMKMPNYLKKRLKFGMIGKFRREFKVGDQVLLFYFHFKFSAGKLVSKWQGDHSSQIETFE